MLGSPPSRAGDPEPSWLSRGRDVTFVAGRGVGPILGLPCSTRQEPGFSLVQIPALPAAPYIGGHDGPETGPGSWEGGNPWWEHLGEVGASGPQGGHPCWARAPLPPAQDQASAPRCRLPALPGVPPAHRRRPGAAPLSCQRPGAPPRSRALKARGGGELPPFMPRGGKQPSRCRCYTNSLLIACCDPSSLSGKRRPGLDPWDRLFPPYEGATPVLSPSSISPTPTGPPPAREAPP